jgi:uncharacterized protein (DUF58 family)
VTSTFAGRRTFPFLPRRRHLVGLPFGGIASGRVGQGTDVIGSRPYQPGDPVSSIDWFASARLSAATGRDEFVVRTRAADEAPRVMVVVDRRPAMNLYAPPLPWLSKRRAVEQATNGIAASAAVGNTEIGSLDLGSGEPYWIAPSRRYGPEQVDERQASAPFDAPEDTVAASLDFLRTHRAELAPGTFVFVLSDFIAGPDDDAWLATDAHGWDLVPVVVQDPIWERSFPPVGSVVVPIRDPHSRRIEPLRLSRREAQARQRANESRFDELLRRFVSLGLEPIVIGTDDPDEIDQAFQRWAEERRQWRRVV